MTRPATLSARAAASPIAAYWGVVRGWRPAACSGSTVAGPVGHHHTRGQSSILPGGVCVWPRAVRTGSVIACQDQARTLNTACRSSSFACQSVAGSPVLCRAPSRVLAWSITVLIGASGRSTTSTPGRGPVVAGVTIRAWLPCRLMFTITTGPSAGGRSQVGERDRAQEVLEALDPADLVHGGVPVPGGLPPLLQHLLLGGLHLIDVAGGIRATDQAGGGCSGRRGMPPAPRPDREPVPAARPGPGAGAGPESTTSTGLPPAVPPPGLGDLRRPPPLPRQTPAPRIPAGDAPESPGPAHARPPTATTRSPPCTPQPRSSEFPASSAHWPHPRAAATRRAGDAVSTPAPSRNTPRAWSRSACCPVRSNRARSAPRGWTATRAGRGGRPGVASTASESRVIAWSRSASCPVRSEPGPQRGPEVGQVPGRSGWSAGVASTASMSR